MIKERQSCTLVLVCIASAAFVVRTRYSCHRAFQRSKMDLPRAPLIMSFLNLSGQLPRGRWKRTVTWHRVPMFFQKVFRTLVAGNAKFGNAENDLLRQFDGFRGLFLPGSQWLCLWCPTSFSEFNTSRRRLPEVCLLSAVTWHNYVNSTTTC